MKLLITGASGMLGNHVRGFARNAGYELITPPRAELDLLDQVATHNFLSNKRPDVIIHTAAVVGGIAANIANPWNFLTQNVRIDSNLLNAAFDLNITKLVYIGSSCMYPRNLEHPMRESEILSGPLEITNEGYALAKIIGTRTVAAASQVSGFSWRSLILSNLYGPHDHFSEDRSHLLAAVIKKVHTAVVSGDPTIEMWGDGTAKREFAYVPDVAQFIVNCISRIDDLPVTLNVGAGVDYSVETYYRMVMEILNYEGQLTQNLEKPTGMQRKLTDSNRAMKFGWDGGTPIRVGLEKTIDWYLQSLEI